MSYFPMCIDLSQARVILVGSGPEIRDKQEKLRPFGPQLLRVDALTAENLEARPALVVVGSLPFGEQARISALCRERNIPVNVVDVPALCTFFYPSLIVKGDLTVCVSTGGKSPAAAAYLRRRVEQQLPDNTEEILDWLARMRQELKDAGIRKAAAEAAFQRNRPLTAEELAELTQKISTR